MNICIKQKQAHREETLTAKGGEGGQKEEEAIGEGTYMAPAWPREKPGFISGSSVLNALTVQGRTN